jgi:hypothetical protein
MRASNLGEGLHQSPGCTFFVFLFYSALTYDYYPRNLLDLVMDPVAWDQSTMTNHNEDDCIEFRTWVELNGIFHQHRTAR